MECIAGHWTTMRICCILLRGVGTYPPLTCIQWYIYLLISPYIRTVIMFLTKSTLVLSYNSHTITILSLLSLLTASPCVMPSIYTSPWSTQASRWWVEFNIRSSFCCSSNLSSSSRFNLSCRRPHHRGTIQWHDIRFILHCLQRIFRLVVLLIICIQASSDVSLSGSLIYF